METMENLYKGLFEQFDEDVSASNPYGCNQYGHEWKGKHGEGWKPSGRGGASDKNIDLDNPNINKIKSSALKNIYNPAKKLLQETREAYNKYKQDKSRENAKEWERKFMEFSEKKREFLRKRVDLNATKDEKDSVNSFFREAEKELGVQFDEVDPNRNAR